MPKSKEFVSSSESDSDDEVCQVWQHIGHLVISLSTSLFYKCIYVRVANRHTTRENSLMSCLPVCLYDMGNVSGNLSVWQVYLTCVFVFFVSQIEAFSFRVYERSQPYWIKPDLLVISVTFSSQETFKFQCCFQQPKPKKKKVEKQKKERKEEEVKDSSGVRGKNGEMMFQVNILKDFTKWLKYCPWPRVTAWVGPLRLKKEEVVAPSLGNRLTCI